ncbi:MAG TPA: AI-2E family transporter [Gemmatimonadales bacterium]|nr:AI-2E family transporter [Gemmatimonadales bacterium]
MSEPTPFPAGLRLLLAGASLVVIIAGMHAAASVISALLLALLLAQTLSPLMVWLIHRKLSPAVAVSITLLVVIVGGGGAITLLGSSLSRLIQRLPVYQASLTQMRDAVVGYLAGRGVHLPPTDGLSLLDPAAIIGYAGGFAASVVSALGNAFVLLFLVAVMLIELAGWYRRHRDQEIDRKALDRFEELSGDVRKFVMITGLSGLVAALGIVILLLALGVDFAVTWGVLFFFLNFVPGIGGILALIPPTTVALLEQGWRTAALVAAGITVLNFVGDNVIKPRFMQQGLEISLLLVVTSLLFWSWVLGPAGAVLAVPLTLAVRRLGQAYWPEIQRTVSG